MAEADPRDLDHALRRAVGGKFCGCRQDFPARGPLRESGRQRYQLLPRWLLSRQTVSTSYTRAQLDAAFQAMMAEGQKAVAQRHASYSTAHEPSGVYTDFNT